MTPKDVDAVCLQYGLIECDCAAVMGKISLLGKASPDEEGGPVSPRGRSSSTASDGLPAGISGESHPRRVVGHLKEFRRTACYVREFLSRPHPQVGRKGPVCPFVPAAIKQDCLYMCMVPTADARRDGSLSVAAMASFVQSFLPVFEALQPCEGKKAQFKALMLIFPEIPAEEAPVYIDQVQAAAKTTFVAKGLMVGEFHKVNNAHGLHNDNFFPLRTPYPTLAIRHMVPTDLAFLDVEKYDLATKRSFLESFLGKFGDETDRKEVIRAQAALEALPPR
jgi:hypothetical protein